MATAKLDRTRRVLAKMLTENTGEHMLDSGGAYGRHWERNQGRDFESEPVGTVEFWYRNGEPDIVASLSVYHFLANRLEYAPQLDRRFYRWATRPSRTNQPWLASADEFAEHVGGRGLYGGGAPFTVNTYNGEDLLSQTIQYVYFELDYTPYVLLQIHGGCDVRGGYTRPYVFQVQDDGAGIMDNARATIACERENAPDPNQLVLNGVQPPGDEPHRWDTDDTAHWYRDGACGMNAGTQLEDYEATDDSEERGQGKLYIDDERNGYCPLCGGKLGIYAY